MFHVGQKVVCIRDCWSSGPIDKCRALPEREQQYMIRSISYEEPVGEGIRLHWLINDLLPTGIEPSFAIRGTDGHLNFRPVAEKKTDISIFEEILRRETVDDRAPAKVHD